MLNQHPTTFDADEFDSNDVTTEFDIIELEQEFAVALASDLARNRQYIPSTAYAHVLLQEYGYNLDEILYTIGAERIA